MEEPDRQQRESAAAPVFCAGNRQGLWRVCNALMSVFFGLAAYVQVNDPDAEVWMVIYLVPSVLVLLVSVNSDITGHGVWRALADLHCAVCLTGAVYLLGKLFMDSRESILHEEEGRELSGLGIIALWLLLCRKTHKQIVGGFRLFIAVSVSVFPFLIWLYIYINKEMRTSWPQHCKTVI
ncbi:transmembrane protein 220 isoform X1 [Spea bombifrons]|uniref:transmembrane protein 220 isoform X1 n=1 Tax=Spea bombifrons TaxID=233779 RepID=UPI00234B8978|nr:transmembrane protein 220 isoform X1 [Spea bombifrons]